MEKKNISADVAVPVEGRISGEANISDLVLVERIMVGDPKAFGALCSKYSPFIRQYAFTRVNSPELADDLTQEVLMKVYTGIGRYRRDYTFSAWVWRVMKNHIVDHYRKAASRVLSTKRNLSISCEDFDAGSSEVKGLVPENTIAGDGMESDMRIRDRERREYVSRLMGLVSDRERRVLYLYFFEGRTYEEICDDMGIPMGTMKVLMMRGKAKMRKSIGGFERIEGLLA